MQSNDREQWVPAFQKEFGMSREQVMELSDMEFCNQRDYLELEGVKPGPQPQTDEAAMEKMMITILKKKAQIRRQQAANAQNLQPQRVQLTQAEQDLITEHRTLQQEQNHEYEEVLRAAKEMELKKEKVDPKKAILEAASRLPPEPEDGVALAVVLPSHKRLARKFARTAKGEDVVTWVSAQEELLNLEDPVKFELRQAAGDIITKDKTLEEQGIVRRTLFNVVLGHE